MQKNMAHWLNKCKDAYIKEFIHRRWKHDQLIPRNKPLCARPGVGFIQPGTPPKLLEKLIERVEKSNRHLGTGFLSTPFLCNVLSENGRSDLAYAILLQEDNPSWLYAINHGATTIWEDWKGIDEKGVPRASLNHYSKGAVVSWFYEYYVRDPARSRSSGI